MERNTEPRYVVNYNHTMGEVDLSDQKLEPYLIEKKGG
jgi:hypothetical protein